ncbi:extracellular solute-binding protein [Pendulispora brunnea]|uniref:Extracellular solute-binding protein n=1 Tax=Pendulispora brunnea TaxID=2905690 RepID=A0ABZ2KT87_9BACT
MTHEESLYFSAKKERRLDLYASGPSSIYRDAIGRFEDRFPGIEVNLTNGYAGTLASSIDAQRKAGAVEADLALLQSIQDFERWRNDGHLEPFEPPGLERILPSFKAPDGTWVGTQVYGIVYAYRSDVLDADSVPRSALDFLDCRFDGKMISGAPHRDDVVLYLYYTLVEKYGWSFMDRLMKNRPTFVEGHAPLARALVEGDFTVTLDAIPWLCLADKRRGAKVDMYISDEDAMPIWAQTAGIFRGARHPCAAKLFLSWYLSQEQQASMARDGTWSPRDDVPPPESLRPLTHYKLADGFREFITNERLVCELRERFQSYIEPSATPR